MNTWLSSLWLRLLHKRLGQSQRYVLQHQHLFVLPSKLGAGCCVLIILLWLLGTNYQNNLILAMAFFLSSVLLYSIFAAYRMLLQLSVHVQIPPLQAAAQPLGLQLHFSSRTPRYGIVLHPPTGPAIPLALLDSQEQTINLALPQQGRGLAKIAPLLLDTQYPFGLVRCWSYLINPQPCWLYPAPYASALSNGHTKSNAHLLDFQQLQPYRAGMPLHHVSWKHVAAHQQWLVKSWQGVEPTKTTQLNYFQLTGEHEQRLSALSALILANPSPSLELLLPSGLYFFANNEHNQALQQLAQEP